MSEGEASQVDLSFAASAMSLHIGSSKGVSDTIRESAGGGSQSVTADSSGRIRQGIGDQWREVTADSARCWNQFDGIARSIITSWARVSGMPVGTVAMALFGSQMV